MFFHLASSLLAILTAGAGLQAGQHASQVRRYAGTWLVESGGTTSLTTLYDDGRFRSDRLAGIRVVATISGRWELRGNSIAWTYDGNVRDPKAPEDVNPIVLESPSQFTLRELDGSETVFHRAGVPDPLSPPRVPIAIGTGWVFKDELGELAIRVTVREKIGGSDCYRVDWIMEDEAYQSEYWSVDAEGIHVIGRRVLGRRIDFAAPYLLVKRTLVAGDTWRASVAVNDRSVDATISVGAEETISTPAGTFNAVPVSLRSDAMRYVRWYAAGVGLVREDSGITDELNTKVLQRRLELPAPPR